MSRKPLLDGRLDPSGRPPVVDQDVEAVVPSSATSAPGASMAVAASRGAGGRAEPPQAVAVQADRGRFGPDVRRVAEPRVAGRPGGLSASRVSTPTARISAATGATLSSSRKTSDVARPADQVHHHPFDVGPLEAHRPPRRGTEHPRLPLDGGEQLAELEPLPAIDPVVDRPRHQHERGRRVSGSMSAGRTTRAKSWTPTRLART